MADRLLVVSYAYPPIAAPEATLAAKALHAIDGFEVDVVCATPMRWHGTDEELVPYAEERLGRVVRVEVPWWLPAVQPLRAMRRYPDAMRFMRRRTRQAVEALEPDRYAALLTWSQWHSVHLVGLDVVAAHPHLAWMAHFSDPWVDNPLVPLDPIARRAAVRWERQVIGTADAVVFTAEPARRITMGRHPASWIERSHVVPHLYDETLYGAGPDPEGRRGLVVRHLGTFYDDRRPDPLLRAIEQVARTEPELLRDVRVELVGSMSPEMRRAVAGADVPPGVLAIVDRVGYRRSLQLMGDADVLVAIDAPSDESLFLASKVVDYLGAGRPIVALVPAGAAADAVRDVGGWVADPRDPRAGADALAAALRHAKRLAGGEWGIPEARRRFAASTVGGQRSAILRHIVDGKR